MTIGKHPNTRLGAVYARALAVLAADRTHPEQIAPILRNGGWVLTTNLVLVLLIGAIFLPTSIAAMALAWTLIGAMLGIAGLAAWWRGRKVPIGADEAGQAADRIMLLAAVRGAHWGAGFLLFMPVADAARQTGLGWALVGLMCGGAMAYSTLPKAATAYVTLLTLGGTLAFLSAGHVVLAILSIALIGLGAILVAGAAATTRLLQTHVEQEKLLAEQNEFMGILLKDFEDSASDWLFELGEGQELRRGAERIAKNLRLEREKVEGKPLSGLLDELAHAQDQRESVARLKEAFDSGAAFADLVVTFGSGSGERFWSIIAKPVSAGAGVWRGVVTDVTAAQQSQRHISHLALHDSLTGLSNRTHFRERLTAAISDLARTGDERSVMCIDLDGFKNINDTFGHHAGDKILVVVARRLKALTRPDDVLSRMGGDEFALLAGAGGLGAAARAEQMLAALAEPINFNGNTVRIGGSIGIVSVGHDAMNAQDLMRYGDLALYRAKASGKGVYCFFEPEMDHALQVRLRTELELKDAIARREFILHFQPIASIETGAIVGYEALIRWKHPVRGIVMPAEFISVAEDGGLITQIGEWVIEEALRQAASWPPDVRISINLAPQQIQSPRLSAAVLKALAASNIRPGRVEFEITESALLDDTEAVLATMNQLKTLGVRISLDDFGTGYSSLGYLHRFAFDNIKIDRSFVHAMATRRESAAVVRAVLGLARDLDISTTAEGIETAEQLAAIKSQGCTEAQGFLIGRPIEAPHAESESRKRA